MRVPIPVQQILALDGEKLACTVLDPSGMPASGSAVMLHGAGTSDQTVHLQLARLLAQRGRRVVTFDFSGHGASSGRLADLSLSRRFEQAQAVIGDLVPSADDLVLVGASMSGQTVADLTWHYDDRVTAVGLLAPAVYPRRSWDLPFGAAFTQAIRVPQAWQDSQALESYLAFTGRAVLAVPGHDHIIPQAVTQALMHALSACAAFTHLVFPDATHHLGRYFRAHPGACARFADALAGP